MEKPKRKNQSVHKTLKLHRTQEFDFTVALSLEECIERIQRLSHKAKRFTLETDVMVAVVDSLNSDAPHIHIRWGAEMPVHTESLLTFLPIDSSTTRIRGRIGVVYRPQLGYIYILSTWIILVYNVIRQQGLSVDVAISLGLTLLIMAIAAFIIFGIPIFTRPIGKRLEGIGFALEEDEKLKRAQQQLGLAEAIITVDTGTSAPIETAKRPNHIPR